MLLQITQVVEMFPTPLAAAFSPLVRRSNVDVIFVKVPIGLLVGFAIEFTLTAFAGSLPCASVSERDLYLLWFLFPLDGDFLDNCLFYFLLILLERFDYH